MMHEIRSLLRGAFLIVAVASGAAMLSATPGQEPDDGECATIVAGSPDGPVDCSYCEINDSGTCEFICADGTKGDFPCSEFDDDEPNDQA